MIRFRTALPVLWPLLLLISSAWFGGLQNLVNEGRTLERRLLEDHRRLDQLRARAVAGRIENAEYQELLQEFAVATALPASDPFRDPKSSALSSVHVASLVTAVQKALLEPGQDDALPEFLSVIPGRPERVGPFVMMEFGLNLRGRFHSLPAFLRLMGTLARHRRLAVSVGELRLDSRRMDPVTGEGLGITLTLRAYFRE